MATFISSPEEQARKKRAATSPMTSLTQKTIQAKPVTAPVKKPASTTAIVPPAPAASTTTAPRRNTAVQAPIYGATNQSGNAGAADAQPIVQPTAPPAAPPATTTGDKSNSAVLSMINGDKGGGGGGGGVSMAPSPYEQKPDDGGIPTQKQGSGAVTAQRTPGITSTPVSLSTTRHVDPATAPRRSGDPAAALAGARDRGQTTTTRDTDPADALAGVRDRGEPADNADIDGLLEDFVRDGLQGETYDDVTIDADPFKNVTIDADPYKDVNIDYKADREMDRASRSNIMKLLGYKEGDTGDEEAYIEKRIADQLGQQLVGSRASMGRAGFGSSGALYGMEGDQMRQANLDAEGRIYDVREREQNQAFDRNMAGAGLADDRDERLYGRSVDDAELDLRNQDERYDRATDQADLDFRNQDEAYGRATDQADLDHRNQTTDFGQRMDVADLDQRGRQGARQDAILKAQMDAINAMTDSAAGDDGRSRPPDSANQTTPGGGIADEDRFNVNLSESSKANIPSAAYSEGSSYAGSDDNFDYFTNAQNQFYKVPKPDPANPNSADKDDLKDAIREGGG